MVSPSNDADLASNRLVRLGNPLSAKFDTLRPSLLPGLVDAVAHNRRHGRRDVRLFEIGTRFTPEGETRSVALAWTGGAAGDHWSGGAREVDFFDVKGAAEQLCDVLEVPVRFEGVRTRFLVAGQAASIVVADGAEHDATIGLVGQVTPAVADARGLPRQDRVLVAELNLDLLARARVARGNHSWHHSGRRPQSAGAACRVQLLRSVSGQGRAGRRGEPVDQVDVPGGRPDLD